MANTLISDFPAATVSEFTVAILFEVELTISPGVTESRKLSLSELLLVLGIPSGTLATRTVGAGTVNTQNHLAYGTNVRKVGEAAGAGTGSLLMRAKLTTANQWNRVFDSTLAVI